MNNGKKGSPEDQKWPYHVFVNIPEKKEVNWPIHHFPPLIPSPQDISPTVYD